MLQIYINPHGTGLTHTLACTNFGLNLSDKLDQEGISNVLFYDCPNLKTFHDIFDVQHKNFSKKPAQTPLDSIEVNNINCQSLDYKNQTFKITANSPAKLNNPLDFFKIYKLIPRCFSLFEEAYNNLDKGKYATIHIRGSCIIKNKHNGDYSYFLERQEKRIQEAIKEIPQDLKILLISDNQDLLVKYVDETRVVSTSIPFKMYKQGVTLTPQTKLHCLNKSYTQDKFTAFQIDFSGVLDLFLMAHGKLIYPDTEYSGYAQTGRELYNRLLKHCELRLLP